MIQLTGYDHRVSIELREAFAREVKRSLPEHYVLLQTCNRIELYSGDGACHPATAEHLLRVASGLESKMIGEAHIQGQVRRAYQDAVDGEHASSGLHRLFQAALRTGKRVRTETAITRGAVSHSQATLQHLLEDDPELVARDILVIGVHHMGKNIIELLQRQGCSRVTLANRNAHKGAALAEELGCGFMQLESALAALPSVIVTATAADEPIIFTEHLSQRTHYLIADLAVPRDVSPKAAALPHVTVRDIEHIEDHIDQNIAARRDEIVQAAAIVRDEVAALC